MIYDCFTFFNELDVLEIRLEELYPVVDKFFVVEGSMTFQGNPKPQYGWENSERFEKYADKIAWCYVNHGWPDGSAWDREYYQRNKIFDFLARYGGMNADDLVILGDADEIPRRSAVEKAIAYSGKLSVQSFALDAYYYGLNISGGHCHTNRIFRWEYLFETSMHPKTMQQVRTLDPPPHIVYDGGWHFSYLGTPDHIAEKFKAFAHTELNRPDTTNPAILEQRMRALGDLWGDGHTYERVEIDETWPELVKADRERWRKYEW